MGRQLSEHKRGINIFYQNPERKFYVILYCINFNDKRLKKKKTFIMKHPRLLWISGIYFLQSNYNTNDAKVKKKKKGGLPKTS